MRATFILAACLAFAGPAVAEEELAFGEVMEAAELNSQRGGTETATEINGSVLQTNETSQSGTNNGSISIGGGAAKVSGTIEQATVAGNRGITAVMQNTGDLVNMNNATSVNVFLQ
ncbi:MAG: hypothetical protein AB1918_09280 [Pseudomonadota bacterium]